MKEGEREALNQFLKKGIEFNQRDPRLFLPCYTDAEMG